MNSRRKIEERIKRKEQEIQELELQIREAKAYIQAMNDAVKLIPDDWNGESGQVELREGSQMAIARDAILKAGKPLHISKLLEAVGKPVDRKHRASLAGSISAYVRKGEIFTRPMPNTFGLVELEQRKDEVPAPPAPPAPPPAPSPPPAPQHVSSDFGRPPNTPPSPPPDFGVDDEDEDEPPF